MAYVFDGFFVWHEPFARIFRTKSKVRRQTLSPDLIEVAEFVARRPILATPALARRI
jgi:3'-phosphoadenosine 5'-phosphosulfate sulfotransferase